MKELIKQHFPSLVIFQILRGFLDDCKRYIKYTSSTKKIANRSKDNIAAKIIAQYHALEKGICMPNFRYGFGSNLLKDLLDSLDYHTAKYGLNYDYIYDASSAIKEYLDIHSDRINLLDSQNVYRAQTFLKTLEPSSSFHHHTQDILEAAECFINCETFKDFALSRRSYRYFDGTPVSKAQIIEAVSIARHAPSSCNRQSSHVHIYTDTDLVSHLLALQGGSRGYGHLGDTLLLITSNIKKTIHVNERHLPYVDGGIFFMSLLYALHSCRVACCPLNCYFPPIVEKRVRAASDIKDYEAIVAMIICGNISGTIKSVKSPRLSVDQFISFH